MTAATDGNAFIRRLFFWGVIVIVAVCLYELAMAIITARTTGEIRVSANDSHAALSISQPGRGAAIIGIGKAGARLKPGSYQVSASDGAALASKTVTIAKHRSSEVSLNLKDSVQLPSTASINFVGQDVLINYGVTSAQVTVLKRAFFKYSPHSKTVIVKDISAVPHDPNSSSVDDTINFNAQVDSKNYKATIDYSALNDYLRLRLYNPDGSIAFDSLNNPGGNEGNE
jgi:hypothetical protein